VHSDVNPEGHLRQAKGNIPSAEGAKQQRVLRLQGWLHIDTVPGAFALGFCYVALSSLDSFA
jgi:hypothetical protein